MQERQSKLTKIITNWLAPRQSAGKKIESDLEAIKEIAESASRRRVGSTTSSDQNEPEGGVLASTSNERIIRIHFNESFFAPKINWDLPKLDKALRILGVGGDLNIYSEDKKLEQNRRPVHASYQPLMEGRPNQNGIYLNTDELDKLAKDKRTRNIIPSKYIQEANKSLNDGLVKYARKQAASLTTIINDRLNPLVAKHLTNVGAVTLSGSSVALSALLPLGSWIGPAILGTALFTAYNLYEHQKSGKQIEGEKTQLATDHPDLFLNWSNYHPRVDYLRRAVGRGYFWLNSMSNQIITKEASNK